MEQLSFKFVAEYEKEKIKSDLIKQINRNNVEISNTEAQADYMRYKNAELNKKLSNL